MAVPISVRLDDDVRATLEEEARSRELGLSTYLRQLATDTAQQLRRDRIRRQTKAVAEHAARTSEAAEFLDGWGTPRSDGV